jgi:HAE1 family hydrophobic/amphiphilic exporter-1
MKEPLSMFSILGIFMLVGIVMKNSILQVDYTNTLRGKGYNRLDALIESNRTRLRPILMTTLTIIAGMTPTALSSGAGAEVRRSMAVVIIGGQSLALLITLLMAPVAYLILDDFQQWIERKFKIKLRRNPDEFDAIDKEAIEEENQKHLEDLKEFERRKKEKEVERAFSCKDEPVS